MSRQKTTSKKNAPVYRPAPLFIMLDGEYRNVSSIRSISKIDHLPVAGTGWLVGLADNVDIIVRTDEDATDKDKANMEQLLTLFPQGMY